MISNTDPVEGDASGDRAASSARERLVAETFRAVADTLVRDFDAVDMLITLTERCVELLDANAAGVMLDDGTGRPAVAATSTEQTGVLEVFGAAGEDGPCSECLRSRTAVACEEMGGDVRLRRPRFSRAARAAGFGAVLALPMRLRDDVIGVLLLLRAQPRAHTARDARLGRRSPTPPHDDGPGRRRPARQRLRHARGWRSGGGP